MSSRIPVSGPRLPWPQAALGIAGAAPPRAVAHGRRADTDLPKVVRTTAEHEGSSVRQTLSRTWSPNQRSKGSPGAARSLNAGSRSPARGNRCPCHLDLGLTGVLTPYPRGMAARKRPTPEDAATARRLLVDGLAHGADIDELQSELAPLHPRDNTFPGEVLLRLAADALAWCGASRADPLDLEGIRERFLPRMHLPRPAKQEAPVRGPRRGSAARRDRPGPSRRGRLVADRRLLAVRPVRNRRLHPCGRQPGRRPSAPGVPGPSPASKPPRAITPLRDEA
jgi:hypothetical protein